MDSLLSLVVEAHGGLKRWASFSDFVTHISARGILYDCGGLAGIAPESRLLLSLREQRSVIIIPQSQERLIVQPERVTHVDQRGNQVATLDAPREAMLEGTEDSNSVFLRAAYYMAGVVRHAVTAPFAYCGPGYEVEEVEPTKEDGELCRVLKVTIPEAQKPTSRVQFSYYGADGMLRCTRTSIDVLSGQRVINCVTGYRDIDGLRIPSSREVFATDDQGRKLPDRSLARFRLSASFFAD